MIIAEETDITSNSMEKSPLVSILIPLYNSGEFVAETMECCLAQTYPNIEIVVVDDHSVDNSVEVAQRFLSDRVRLYTNPKKGGNSARNYAFEMSHGDYVLFHDADDLITKGHIQSLMDAIMQRGTNDSAAFSPIYMLEADGKLWQPPTTIDRDFVPGIEMLVGIWTGAGFRCPHCHLVPRHLVDSVGRWDESVLKNQDGEFFARVYNAADKMLFSGKNEYAIWRQRKGTVSRNKNEKALASYISTFKGIAKMILDYQNTEENRNAISRGYGYWLYENYPFSKDVERVFFDGLRENGLSFILPKRRTLTILKSLFGWRLALRVINKFNL